MPMTAHFFRRRQLRRVLPVDGHRAFPQKARIPGVDARHHIEQRRFTAAGRPRQHGDGVLFKPGGKLLQNGAALPGVGKRNLFDRKRHGLTPADRR